MNKDQQLAEILNKYAEMVRNGEITSFAPLLHLLRFENKPLTLKKHFQLEPLFGMHMPKRQCVMCCRQIGKSVSLAAQTLLTSSLIPYYHSLVIQPLFSQIRNFSNQIFRPLMVNSYIAENILDESLENNMLIRTFKNGSRVHFSYSSDKDASRVRGISGISRCAFDETQHLFEEVIPIVGETMSAVEDFGIYQFSGTPLTTDNLLNRLYEQGSMGEIVIPCDHCHYSNVAGIKQDLLKMIGKTTCICAKCGKPLDPRKGFLEFEHPERRNSFMSWHVSAITHPLHCTNKDKWSELLYKYETYSKSTFLNEVLGVPCDENVKLLSVQELKKASHNRPNTIEAAKKVLQEFATILCGVDWGGGGVEGQSTTTIAVMGQRPGQKKLEVIYCERLPPGMGHLEEVARIMNVAKAFGAKILAHDATGAGALRESILMNQGASSFLTIVPFTYVFAPRQELIKFHPATGSSRPYYTLDKSRSLYITVCAIKACQILLPEYNSAAKELDDFLALAEEIRELPNSSQLHLIVRGSSHPDDMAHAVSLGAHAFWYINRCLPSLGSLEKWNVSKENMDLIAPENPKW